MNVIGTSLPAATRPPAPGNRPASGSPSTADAGEPPPSAALWDILTPEERAFFAREADLGSLSYRPRRPATDPTGPTGQRVDVRG